MSTNRSNDWRILGCAVALAVAIALPAGIFIGRYGSHESDDGAADRVGSAGARARDPYSPNFRSDPYVIEQQRRVVEALEKSCEETKQHCTEAIEARRRVEETAAGR